jgi:hypothetical protein
MRGRIRVALAAVSGTLVAFSAFAEDYRRQKLVNVPPGQEGQNEIPVPFPIPQPGQGSYRTVADYDNIIASPGEAQIVRRFQVGSTLAGVGSQIPSYPLYAVEVTGGAAARPDASTKGVAMVLGAIHGREWMAIEGVFHKLQTFQSSEFSTDLSDDDSPRGQDAFFAENVRLVILPLMNRGGVETTQRHHEYCFLRANNGELFEGRFRRKNLLGTDGVMTGDTQATDADALYGIDLNRNQQSPSTGSVDSSTQTYKGPVQPGTAATGAPESEAFRAAVLAAFGQSPRQTSLTGGAFVDVHTASAQVIHPPNANAAVTQCSDAIVQRVAGIATLIAVDSPDTGTSKDYVHDVVGVPAVTLELPEDPAVAGLSFLVFLVGEGDYDRQRRCAMTGIDAALDWAAGPPYVKELLLLQDKDRPDDGRPRDGHFDPSLVDGDAEVIYSRRFVGTSTERELSAALPGNRWFNKRDGAGRLVIVFSKPMRGAVNGAPPTVTFRTETGLNIPLGPAAQGSWPKSELLTNDTPPRTQTITSIGADRYEHDTWVREVVLPDGITLNDPNGEIADFVIEATDQVTLPLDSNPGTIATWRAGAFEASYERTLPDGTPSPDRNFRGFRIDTTPPRIVAGDPRQR